MAITILAVAMPPITALYRGVAEHSVDDIFQGTARVLAESVMEEIASCSFRDPDGIDSSFGAEEPNRNAYDDVDDYDGLVQSPPPLRDGSSTSLWEGLTLEVTVDNVTPDDPDPLSPEPDGSTDLKRIQVSVSWHYGRGGVLTLTSLRAAPPEEQGVPDPLDGVQTYSGMLDAWDIVVCLELTSNVDDDLVIERFELSTPSGPDHLVRLQYDGVRIWSTGSDLPTGVTELTGLESLRTLEAGDSVDLYLHLTDLPASGSYPMTLVLFFADGTSDHIDFSASW